MFSPSSRGWSGGETETSRQLKAQTLLEHAGNGGAAEKLRAVIDIVQGNYDSAKRHLDAAERQGINVAKNREAIRLLMQ